MICTQCSGLTFVVDTQKDSQSVIRRRECKQCGLRFNTRESYFTRPIRERKIQVVPEAKPKPLTRRANDWEREALVVPKNGYNEFDELESDILREIGVDESGWTENY